MPRGLPKGFIQRARRELGPGASYSDIFRRAWQLYKSSKVYPVLRGKTQKNPGNPGKKRKRRGGVKLAKKRRRRKTTIPLAAVGGAMAGLFIKPPNRANSPVGFAMTGNLDRAFVTLLESYTGYNMDNGQWNITNATGLHAAIIGFIGHKIASILGINRALGRAKIPLIRI